jgi:hypothetical protein
VSAELTADQVAAAIAWVVVLGRVRREDRRMIAVLASGDVGNRDFVHCAAHGMPSSRPMTFTEAYSHMMTAPSACSLYPDQLAPKAAS